MNWSFRPTDLMAQERDLIQTLSSFLVVRLWNPFTVIYTHTKQNTRQKDQ